MKKENRKVYTNERGITLIALVVTIVVLLILAGITINMLFSENGIIKKAQKAANETEKAQEEERELLDGVSPEIDNILASIGSNKIGKFEVKSKVEGSTVTLTATIDGYDNFAEYCLGRLEKLIKGIKTDAQKEKFMLNCANFMLEKQGKEKVDTIEKAEAALEMQDMMEMYDTLEPRLEETEEDLQNLFEEIWMIYFSQIRDEFTEEELDNAALKLINLEAKKAGEETYKSVSDFIADENSNNGTSYTTMKQTLGEEYLYAVFVGMAVQIGTIDVKCNGNEIDIDTSSPMLTEGMIVQYELTEAGTYTFEVANGFDSKTVNVEYAP